MITANMIANDIERIYTSPVTELEKIKWVRLKY